MPYQTSSTRNDCERKFNYDWPKIDINNFFKRNVVFKLFKFLAKSMHGPFLIFCQKLQQQKGLKWTAFFFFGKTFIDMLGQKELKMGPKLGF